MKQLQQRAAHLIAAFTFILLSVAPAWAQPPACGTLCLRAPQYYLSNLNRLPHGVVIAGSGFNYFVSTANKPLMRLALDGGNSSQDRFYQQFVAAQLSLLAAPGQDQAALQSRLSCYGLDFAPARMNDGTIIGPNSSLGDLIHVARRAALSGSTTEMQALTRVLSLLNGSDPLGRCNVIATLSFPAQTLQQLDALVEQYARDKNLPSVAVGVWAPGAGQYVMAKGTANLATGAPRDINDPFRIASITKTFTATAILQLIDQGLLSKTDKLAKWFPDFPKADQIRIDDLLRMRSGIADSADEELLKLYYDNPLIDFPPSASFARSSAKEKQFTDPNQKTIYTNVNFNFLEVIVERVTGRSLGAQITECILKPLGMNNTLYPYDNNLPGNLRGYSLNPQTGQFEDKTALNPSLPGGAGAMISTLADLKVYARALATGALLKPATQAARLQGQPLDGLPDWVRYGEGIEQIGKFYGHNGTIFGSSSEMYYLPEKDAVIVINVNRLDIDDHSQSSELFFLIAKLLFPEHVNW